MTFPIPERAAYDLQRFWAKVDKSGECWIWLGYLDKSGYGQFQLGLRRQAHRTVRTHRLAYEVLIGPVPEGLQLDHLCRVRRCCNPEHLEPVTLVENVRRGVPFRPSPEACPQGHPYTQDNTYVPPGGRGRHCRACHRTANREFWRRRNAA